MKTLIYCCLSILLFHSCSHKPTPHPSLKEDVDVASVITGPDYSDTFSVKIKKNSYKYNEAVKARRLAAAKMRQEMQNDESEGMIRLRKKTDSDY